MVYNKKEPKVTRENGKYKKIAEAAEITGVSREVLLYRLKIYQEKSKDTVLYQVSKNGEIVPYYGSKEPILIDWDHVTSKIPTLIESKTIQDIIEKMIKLEEEIHIIKEVCYTRGFLSRNKK